jgi:hypothetical protein
LGEGKYVSRVFLEELKQLCFDGYMSVNESQVFSVLTWNYLCSYFWLLFKF